MFKAGQKVKCIDPGNAGAFRIGRTYSVVSVGDNGMYGNFTDDLGKTIRKACKRFILAKEPLPPPKNDIEWLDRVQQNFKE
jgi:hypothetical protein